MPLPSHRLSLSRNGPAAAEWEAALDDLPKLAVAAGGDGARAASSNVAGSSASVGGDRGVGGSSTCVLRRALLALPPFPLEQLLQQEQEQKGFQAGRGESGGGDSGNAAGVDGTLLESGGSPELWRAYQMLSFLSHVSWMERGDGKPGGREEEGCWVKEQARKRLGGERGVGGICDGMKQPSMARCDLKTGTETHNSQP